MAITSFDNYMAARKQPVSFNKSSARTTIANSWFSMFELAGNPGAGTLAGSSTTAGVVPVAGGAGFPGIGSVGSQRAYLTIADIANSVPGRVQWFDMLWKGGAYAFNSGVTLSVQPSFASRMVLDPDGQPGTSIYNGTQVWIEFVTAFTGVLNVVVTYTNQAGVAAQTTGVIATVAGTVGRCFQLPLQAGDSGVQKIESVTASIASAGTFNVLVLRPLGGTRVLTANGQDVMGIDRTGMPLIFDTTALYPLFAPDSTSSGLPDFIFEVASN